MGLKDQYRALKWTHHNIVAFGGHKQRITLMGQSAGTYNNDSVKYIILSFSYRYFMPMFSIWSQKKITHKNNQKQVLYRFIITFSFHNHEN